jgi:hypothetical protein
MNSAVLAERSRAEWEAAGYRVLKPHIVARITGGVLHTMHFTYTRRDSHVWWSAVPLAQPDLSLNRGAPGTCGRVPSADAPLAQPPLSDEQLGAAIAQALRDDVMVTLDGLCDLGALCDRMDTKASVIAHFVRAFACLQDGRFENGREHLRAFLSDARLAPQQGLTVLDAERRTAAALLEATDDAQRALVAEQCAANVKRLRLGSLLR